MSQITRKPVFRVGGKVVNGLIQDVDKNTKGNYIIIHR